MCWKFQWAVQKNCLLGRDGSEWLRMSNIFDIPAGDRVQPKGVTRVGQRGAAAPLADRFFSKKGKFLKKICIFWQKIGFCRPWFFFILPPSKISSGYTLGPALYRLSLWNEIHSNIYGHWWKKWSAQSKCFDIAMASYVFFSSVFYAFMNIECHFISAFARTLKALEPVVEKSMLKLFMSKHLSALHKMNKNCFGFGVWNIQPAFISK